MIRILIGDYTISCKTSISVHNQRSPNDQLYRAHNSFSGMTEIMNFPRAFPAPFHPLVSLIFYTAVCVPNSIEWRARCPESPSRTNTDPATRDSRIRLLAH